MEDKLTVFCATCDFYTPVHPWEIAMFSDKIQIAADCGDCCKRIVLDIEIPEE